MIEDAKAESLKQQQVLSPDQRFHCRVKDLMLLFMLLAPSRDISHQQVSSRALCPVLPSPAVAMSFLSKLTNFLV